MSKTRLDIDTYGLFLAHVVSLRSTCRRRRAGCVVIDSQKHIRATGYNGVPRHMVHCLDVSCSGATAAPGTHLDECMAVHAEENALLQMDNKYSSPFTLYLTCTPCLHCAKIISNFSGITRVIASKVYPDKAALEMLKKGGVHLEILPLFNLEALCETLLKVCPT